MAAEGNSEEIDIDFQDPAEKAAEEAEQKALTKVEYMMARLRRLLAVDIDKDCCVCIAQGLLHYREQDPLRVVYRLLLHDENSIVRANANKVDEALQDIQREMESQKALTQLVHPFMYWRDT